MQLCLRKCKQKQPTLLTRQVATGHIIDYQSTLGNRHWGEEIEQLEQQGNLGQSNQQTAK